MCSPEEAKRRMAVVEKERQKEGEREGEEGEGGGEPMDEGNSNQNGENNVSLTLSLLALLSHSLFLSRNKLNRKPLKLLITTMTNQLIKFQTTMKPVLVIEIRTTMEQRGEREREREREGEGEGERSQWFLKCSN